MFDNTFSFLTSVWIITDGTAAFWMSVASSFVTLVPASAKTSPVVVLITSSAKNWPTILLWKASFLLYLYLPTLARSYLLASKNMPEIIASALSTLSGSPGRIFLYNSKRPLS